MTDTFVQSESGEVKGRLRAYPNAGASSKPKMSMRPATHDNSKIASSVRRPVVLVVP